MNSKLSILTAAAVLTLTADISQAASWRGPMTRQVIVERRIITDAPLIQPQIIGERLDTIAEPGVVGTPATIYSNSTLGGRRDFYSNGGVVIQNGSRARVYWMDGTRMKSLPVRGNLP